MRPEDRPNPSRTRLLAEVGHVRPWCRPSTSPTRTWRRPGSCGCSRATAGCRAASRARSASRRGAAGCRGCRSGCRCSTPRSAASTAASGRPTASSCTFENTWCSPTLGSPCRPDTRYVCDTTPLASTSHMRCCAVRVDDAPPGTRVGAGAAGPTVPSRPSSRCRTRRPRCRRPARRSRSAFPWYFAVPVGEHAAVARDEPEPVVGPRRRACRAGSRSRVSPTIGLDAGDRVASRARRRS